MIKVGDNFYRNLEEQVQYLTNYHDVNQGLVQWGIRVVGQIADASELPAVYNGDFGDAYAVGTEAPFFFYIWTRAAATGESDYWFPFGEISIAGPQGPQGPQGEPGATGESSMWYYGALPSNPKEGDMLLQANGNVLRYQKTGPVELSWVQLTNIKGATGLQGVQGPRGLQGPQGEPGPKGDTGDVGGFINIYGVLTNVNELPNPDTLGNRTIAYLIGSGYPYDLYIQSGDADGPVVWVNTGPLNVSTLVYVNGEAQNTWNADTKVDKVTSGGDRRVYAINESGGQTTYRLDNKISASPTLQIVCRDPGGQVTVPPVPRLNTDAVSKGYVNSLVDATKTEYNYNFINGYSNRSCVVKIYKQRNQLNIIVAGQLNIDPNTFIPGSVQSIIEFTLDEKTSRKLFVGASNTAAGNIATMPGTYYNDQNYQTTVVPFIIRRTAEDGNVYWIRFTGSGLTTSSTLTDVNMRLSLPLD